MDGLFGGVRRNGNVIYRAASGHGSPGHERRGNACRFRSFFATTAERRLDAWPLEGGGRQARDDLMVEHAVAARARRFGASDASGQQA